MPGYRAAATVAHFCPAREGGGEEEREGERGRARGMHHLHAGVPRSRQRGPLFEGVAVRRFPRVIHYPGRHVAQFVAQRLREFAGRVSQR